MYLNAEEIYAKNVELGYMPEEIANRLAKDALAMYGAAPTSTLENIVHFDAGLVSMQIMLLAKEMDMIPFQWVDLIKRNLLNTWNYQKMKFLYYYWQLVKQQHQHMVLLVFQ